MLVLKIIACVIAFMAVVDIAYVFGVIVSETIADYQRRQRRKYGKEKR